MTKMINFIRMSVGSWKSYIMVLSRIHMSSENITNRTLAFLTENYPSYVKVVPKEVLAFGLPSTSVSLLTSCYIFLLSLTSLSGNFLMIFLYIRYDAIKWKTKKNQKCFWNYIFMYIVSAYDIEFFSLDTRLYEQLQTNWW